MIWVIYWLLSGLIFTYLKLPKIEKELPKFLAYLVEKSNGKVTAEDAEKEKRGILNVVLTIHTMLGPLSLLGFFNFDNYDKAKKK